MVLASVADRFCADIIDGQNAMALWLRLHRAPKKIKNNLGGVYFLRFSRLTAWKQTAPSGTGWSGSWDAPVGKPMLDPISSPIRLQVHEKRRIVRYSTPVQPVRNARNVNKLLLYKYMMILVRGSRYAHQH